VDGLTAKQICPAGTTNVRAGRLLIGSVQRFTYDGADDVWRVHGLVADEIPAGAVMMHTATTAPAGWTRCNGRTIGNAASSATERANADTADLYTHLWTNFADAQCPVTGGRGASAAADYAANKAISLPDWRGRSPFGLDDMGNSAAGRLGTIITDETTNGATGGAETVTLLQSDLPNATLTVSGTTDNPGNHTHNLNNIALVTQFAGGGTNAYDTGGGDSNTGAAGGHTHTVSGTTSSINGNVTQTAFGNMPPAFLTTWIIKL
jgi:microcystin-dependent protein